MSVRQIFRALSGSQYVYFSSNEKEPAGISDKVLAASFEVESDFPSTETTTPGTSTIGLWNLNKNLSSSIDSRHFASVDGTGASIDHTAFFLTDRSAPGGQALYFDGTYRIELSVANSTVFTLNSISVSFMAKPSIVTSGDGDILIRHSGQSNNQSDNAQFALFLDATSPNGLQYGIETGGGVDDGFNTDPIGLPEREWTHVGLTRTESGLVKLFINGEIIATGSNLLPDGGSNSRVTLGTFPRDSTVNQYTGMVSSLKIVSGTISDNEMRLEAARALGK